MKSVQSLLLLDICCPCLIPASIVDCHLCLDRELGVLHLRGEVSECGCCFPNPLVYFCVQGEVAADCRPEVHELVHNFQLMVVNGKDWWHIYILS